MPIPLFRFVNNPGKEASYSPVEGSSNGSGGFARQLSGIGMARPKTEIPEEMI